VLYNEFITEVVKEQLEIKALEKINIFVKMNTE